MCYWCQCLCCGCLGPVYTLPPAFNLAEPAGLLILPTCQHAKVDLVQTGQLVEDEKDALLEKVMLQGLAAFIPDMTA